MSEEPQTAAAVIQPVAKAGSAWVAVGITSWSDVAAALAAAYTLLLIIEWLWKRLGRPFLERRGMIKRFKRRRDDLAG